MKEQQSIEALQTMISSFCEQRDWTQFHNPKDLAIGISTEANELLEIFRFKNEAELSSVTTEKKEEIANELSDVFFYVLRFAELNNIDLTAALHNKMAINAQHYPVDKARGSTKKYNEF